MPLEEILVHAHRFDGGDRSVGQDLLDAARSLAELARDHELIVTHGNGPQVGLLALQSAAYSEVATAAGSRLTHQGHSIQAA